ncbi:hypothetical protein [Propioniciclava soli]|uniref:Uncharacterized protein n=1 Tax=Propioniciclava soli TaxID=2775081 RepID=A0ABZ3CAJ3_9ACTN|nr:hypothetical protein [Propioniciclava soli]
MSPINENELRNELWYAHDGAEPDTDRLTASVLQRGRTVRRNRTIAGGLAAVVLLGGATFGIGSLLENTTQRGVPVSEVSPTPTATTTASPSPTPSTSPGTTPTPGSPTSATTPAGDQTPPADPPASATPAWPDYTDNGIFPADFGDLGGFRLLHEGTPATDEVTAWEEESPVVRFCDQAPGALVEVEAGRHIQARGPAGMGWDESVLVFRTEQAAIDFLDQVRSYEYSDEACSRDEQTPGWRDQWALAELNDLGDDAIGLSWWTQAEVDGTWADAPGGSLSVSVRQGRAVYTGLTFGEYVGDPLDADALAELQPFFDDALAQDCPWPGGC